MLRERPRIQGRVVMSTNHLRGFCLGTFSDVPMNFLMPSVTFERVGPCVITVSPTQLAATRHQEAIHVAVRKKARGGKRIQGLYLIFTVLTVLSECFKNPGRVPEVVLV